MKKKIVHIITYILFILFALIIIFPLIWMVITGFKTNQELFLSPFSLPETWHWENYVNAWNKGIVCIGGTLYNYRTLFYGSIFWSSIGGSLLVYVNSIFMSKIFEPYR